VHGLSTQATPYENAATPDTVLLDLNMPVMDGREVLAEIVKDDALRHLTVVILTTSAAEADILDMHRLRCSSYIVKPVGFQNFSEVVRRLGNYWLTMVVVPTVGK
jgi:two-component system, chemotaxis family, response regulator Rcp1